MDEEIEDEQRKKLDRYSSPDGGVQFTRRIRTELPARCEGRNEVDAIIEHRREGKVSGGKIRIHCAICKVIRFY